MRFKRKRRKVEGKGKGKEEEGKEEREIGSENLAETENCFLYKMFINFQKERLESLTKVVLRVFQPVNFTFQLSFQNARIVSSLVVQGLLLKRMEQYLCTVIWKKERKNFPQ